MRSVKFCFVAMMAILSSIQVTLGQSAIEVLQERLKGAIRVSVYDEVKETIDTFTSVPDDKKAKSHDLPGISLTATERWSSDSHGLMWEMGFTGSKKRAGHTVTIELPVVKEGQAIFTPSDYGVVSVTAFPTFKPPVYAHNGWDLHHYVLPLTSVFDSEKDSALTIALRPDENIPHLQIDWMDAKTLRLELKHRAMGGDKVSGLRVRFYSHAADYRSVLRAYSDEFPRYFKPVLPRGEYEGPFWYHHIQAHPDFAEMARQNIRYIWMSFWFTHLGEYLPVETEWAPYTYARWWRLEEMMSDEKIRVFVREMHDHGIGAYAYFNVTEYGGIGGAEGDANKADRILREQFADALMKNKNGEPIPTWEGSLAMNAGKEYSLFPFIVEQLRRHLTRLPEIDGFIIDRLDWASMLDYGHDDGQTMVADQPAENMVWPVSAGVGEVLRQSHAAGKRVIVNQQWRVEMLRDVDGYCHEADYLPGLGYLSPYRPASAWHHRKPYGGDLLQFEGQLKRRLQYALMPQMITHEFPISQQGADPEAADMLEIYAPLFATLDGKEQVLLPHCVEATGLNDVNLFTNRDGNYVAALTSRVRFLSRRVNATEAVTLRLNVPDAESLKWAYVISADAGPSKLKVSHEGKKTAVISVPQHGTSSMVVVGKGRPAVLPELDTDRFTWIRDRLFPLPKMTDGRSGSRLRADDVKVAIVFVKGTHLGLPDPIRVLFGDKDVGMLTDDTPVLPVTWPKIGSAAKTLSVCLVRGNEGTWFAPEEIALAVQTDDGDILKVAKWTCNDNVERTDRFGERYILDWIEPEAMQSVKAEFEGRDESSGGVWQGKLGSLGAWIPGVKTGLQNGFDFSCNGNLFVWATGTDDRRALQGEDDSSALRKATCWYSTEKLTVTASATADKPYRLSLYLLDFDRNGRSLEVRLMDQMGRTVENQKVSTKETASGVYLTWTVTGPVKAEVKKLAGFNSVISGIFVDPVK